MSDNLIVFPKGKLGSPPQSLEDIVEAVVTNRNAYISHLAESITEDVLLRLEDANVDLENAEGIRHIAMLTDALRACICKSMGVEHPLDSLIEERYDIVYEDDFICAKTKETTSDS